MKLSEMTKQSVRARDLIEIADAQNTIARRELELVSWISPAGDYYIEPRAVIEQIIATRSW